MKVIDSHLHFWNPKVLRYDWLKGVPWTPAPRRPGDPAALFAAVEKAHTELGWTPRLSDLESIVRTAWAWHKSHPHGYTRG